MSSFSTSSSVDPEEVYTLEDYSNRLARDALKARCLDSLAEINSCTYSQGYHTQPVFVCLTCQAASAAAAGKTVPPHQQGLATASTNNDDDDDYATAFGVCLGCSLNCHAGHTVVELGDRRRFRCDCGNSRCPHPAVVAAFIADEDVPAAAAAVGAGAAFGGGPEMGTATICSLSPSKPPLNRHNVYTHNFRGLFCRCRRPYDLTRSMRGCVRCEDYYHDDCTLLPPPPLTAASLPKPLRALVAGGLSDGTPATASSTDKTGGIPSADAAELLSAFVERVSQDYTDAEAHVFLCAPCARAAPTLASYSLANPVLLAEAVGGCTRTYLQRARLLEAAVNPRVDISGAHAVLPPAVRARRRALRRSAAAAAAAAAATAAAAAAADGGGGDASVAAKDKEGRSLFREDVSGTATTKGKSEGEMKLSPVLSPLVGIPSIDDHYDHDDDDEEDEDDYGYDAGDTSSKPFSIRASATTAASKGKPTAEACASPHTLRCASRARAHTGPCDNDDDNYHCQLVAHCLTCPMLTPSNCELSVCSACAIRHAAPIYQEVCLVCAYTCHRGHTLVNWRVDGAYCDCGTVIGSSCCVGEGLTTTTAKKDASPQEETKVSTSGACCGDGSTFRPCSSYAAGPFFCSATPVTELPTLLGQCLRPPSLPDTAALARGGASTQHSAAAPEGGFDLPLCTAWRRRLCLCPRCSTALAAEGALALATEPEISTIGAKLRAIDDVFESDIDLTGLPVGVVVGALARGLAHIAATSGASVATPVSAAATPSLFSSSSSSSGGTSGAATGAASGVAQRAVSAAVQTVLAALDVAQKAAVDVKGGEAPSTPPPAPAPVSVTASDYIDIGASARAKRPAPVLLDGSASGLLAPFAALVASAAAATAAAAGTPTPSAPAPTPAPASAPASAPAPVTQQQQSRRQWPVPALQTAPPPRFLVDTEAAAAEQGRAKRARAWEVDGKPAYQAAAAAAAAGQAANAGFTLSEAVAVLAAAGAPGTSSSSTTIPDGSMPPHFSLASSSSSVPNPASSSPSTPSHRSPLSHLPSRPAASPGTPGTSSGGLTYAPAGSSEAAAARARNNKFRRHPSGGGIAGDALSRLGSVLARQSRHRAAPAAAAAAAVMGPGAWGGEDAHSSQGQGQGQEERDFDQPLGGPSHGAAALVAAAAAAAAADNAAADPFNAAPKAVDAEGGEVESMVQLYSKVFAAVVADELAQASARLGAGAVVTRGLMEGVLKKAGERLEEIKKEYLGGVVGGQQHRDDEEESSEESD